MASKEAALFVTMNQQGFITGLRTMKTEVASTARANESALKASFKNGLGSAKDSMKGMFGGLKDNIKTVASLGGAVSLAKFATDAVHIQNTFTDIANLTNRVKGNTETWRSIQALLAPVAEQTGQSMTDLGATFKDVFEGTGDLEYTKGAMQAIATTATATGTDLATLGNLATMAYEKWGVAAEDLGPALTRFIEKTGTGGAGLQSLSTDFGLLAESAKKAGMTGAEGITSLLGLVNNLDDNLGDQTIPKLKMVFGMLENGGATATAMQDKMRKNGVVGFKFEADGSPLDKIRQLVSSEKGRAVAKLSFSGETIAVYDAITKPFQAAYKAAKELKKSEAEATAEGLKAFDESMAAMKGSSMQYSTVQKQAADRLKEDPSIKLRMAIDRMAVAFTDPRMMGAVDSLANMLPGVAEGFLKVLNFVLKHPLLSGGGYIAAKIGLSFAGGAVASAGPAIGAGIMGVLGPAWSTLAASSGAIFGGAASVAMVAGAAVLGWQIGKAMAEAMANKDNERLKKGFSADMTATNAVNDKSTSLTDLEAQLANVRAKKRDIGKVGFNSVMGGAMNFFAGNSKSSQAEAQAWRKQTRDVPLQMLTDTENKLLAAIAKQKEAGDSAGNMSRAMDTAAESIARFSSSIPGGGGGGGGAPVSNLSTAPGYFGVQR